TDGRLTLSDGKAGAPPARVANSALAGREPTARILEGQALAAQLHGVFVADNLAEGLALRQHLAAGESLITREGVWLGPDWLSVSRGFDEKAGMIRRQEELTALATEIETVEAQVDELETRADTLQEQLKGHEQAKEDIIRHLGE